jgi:alginate O-acetyltransferase complex protein AlgI
MLCFALGVLAVTAPNSNRIGEQIHRLCATGLSWRAMISGCAITLAILLITLNEARESVSAFIYFNF